MNKWLKIENAVQRRLIGQLKNLVISNEIAPACTLGHRYCRINHQIYNYVKPDRSHSCELLLSSVKVESAKPMIKPCIGNVSFRGMSKTIDKLRSKYGLPPL